jgi:hypothetical protein
MRSILHDEYQDRTTAGCLASAQSHWLNLRTAQALLEPQQFSFAFACPTSLVAEGLAGFLASGPYADVTASGDGAAAPTDTWQVAGTTAPKLPALPCLEDLFMGLRHAAQRFDSQLIALDLISTRVALAPGA